MEAGLELPLGALLNATIKSLEDPSLDNENFELKPILSVANLEVNGVIYEAQFILEPKIENHVGESAGDQCVTIRSTPKTEMTLQDLIKNSSKEHN